MREPSPSKNESSEQLPDSTKVNVLRSARTSRPEISQTLTYYIGARLGDCCRTAWADVDLSEGTLACTQSKAGEKVTAPLHSDLLAHLKKLAGTDKLEVLIMPRMAHLQSGVRKLSLRTFHALRHSFTGALANNGVVKELRMKLTGHKTEAEHQKYTHHELDSNLPKSASDASRPAPQFQKLARGKMICAFGCRAKSIIISYAETGHCRFRFALDRRNEIKFCMVAGSNGERREDETAQDLGKCSASSSPAFLTP